MARLKDDSRMSVDMNVTASPSMSMQYSEESSPIALSFRNICSKLVPSDSSRPEHQTCVQTPDCKTHPTRCISPLVKTRHAFNPFNQNLKERLEKPVFSPTVFSTVMSPSEDSDEFKWTIEDLSKIKPAPIEEEFHFDSPVDEQTETEIQQSIDRYFTMTHQVPSPWSDIDQQRQKALVSRQAEPNVSSSPYPALLCRLDGASRTPCQDVSTQTVLSLPPDLPENIHSMLKQYCSDTSSDDMSNSMNMSLRRKLFFKKEDDALSPVSLFRLREDSPSIDVRATGSILSRTDGSPFTLFSPLGISPIAFVDKKSECNNSISPVHSTAQGSDSKKENIDPSGNQMKQSSDECYKIFESPKLSMGVRRKRKRRRSLAPFMETSTSYLDFYAKHNSTEKAAPKYSVCPDESKMSMDTFSDNAVDSEDTGYGTTSFRFATPNDSELKFTFNTWLNKLKNRTNTVNASTPAKN